MLKTAVFQNILNDCIKKTLFFKVTLVHTRRQDICTVHYEILLALPKMERLWNNVVFSGGERRGPLFLR